MRVAGDNIYHLVVCRKVVIEHFRTALRQGCWLDMTKVTAEVALDTRYIAYQCSIVDRVDRLQLLQGSMCELLPVRFCFSMLRQEATSMASRVSAVPVDCVHIQFKTILPKVGFCR